MRTQAHAQSIGDPARKGGSPLMRHTILGLWIAIAVLFIALLTIHIVYDIRTETVPALKAEWESASYPYDRTDSLLWSIMGDPTIQRAAGDMARLYWEINPERMFVQSMKDVCGRDPQRCINILTEPWSEN